VRVFTTTTKDMRLKPARPTVMGPSVREKQGRILKGLVGKRKEKEKGKNSGKQIFYHLRIEGRPQIFPYPSSSLIFRAEK
jgi:hypothetical protein